MRQADAVPPRFARPYGARRESAATVRADIFQHFVDAFSAKGALVAADAGVEGIGRQIPIAAFAVGA